MIMRFKHKQSEFRELIFKSSSLEDLAKDLIPGLMVESGATAGSILLKHDEVLTVHTAYGLKKNRGNEARIPIGVGVTGQAIQTETVQWIPDVDEIENYIEGVPDATWELAIPLTGDEHDSSIIIDLEANSLDRPDKKRRDRIIEFLNSIKTPVLNLADKERLTRFYQKDSLSSTLDRKHFISILDERTSRETEFNGILFVIELEPRLEDPTVTSYSDLKLEIQSIGTQLSEVVADDALITRFYGNLYGVYIPSLSAEDVEETKRSIRERLADDCSIEQLNFESTTNTEDGIEDLINKAFVELNYSDKDAIKNQSLRIDDILRRGEIELYQQSIKKPETRNTVGHEILVRGPKDSKLRSPNRLFKAAYKEERIVELDSLIVKKIFDQYPTKADRTIFLNVERRSICDRDWRTVLIENVRQLSSQTNVCIEITEHGDLKDLANPIEKINDELGSNVLFAIDDFGTGTSNFKAIIDLEPDIVKIDRSLISQVDEEFGQRSLIESILNFSTTTDIDILAEGIEETEEWNILKELGIDLAQGYFFSKPESIRSANFGTGSIAYG